MITATFARFVVRCPWLVVRKNLNAERTTHDARRTTKHAVRSTGGFTLLEMMLALILFATGTVAAMELLHRAQAGSTDGENVLIATQLAQRRLEELRNTTYASLANEAKASVTTPSGYTRFSREVTVTAPYTNLRQVVVTVYWNAAGGETNVTLQTYRSAS